jgi:hypothetical protein
MRGRNQALWVSVLGAGTLMFSWLSAAVLALVTLRKGPREGAYILAWAILPAGVVLGVFGDPTPLGMIVGTTLLAVLLRWTVSLELTLCASSALGLVAGLGMLALGGGYLAQLEAFFAEFFANLQQQLTAQGRDMVQVQAPGRVTIAGLLGFMNALTCVVCLLLARWWQALLYNPGGFRAEFHGLRFTPATSGVLLVLVLAISSLGLEYRPWAVLFAVPLSMAGLGLVHARAAHRGFGAGYLTVFYLLWVFFDAVKVIVIGLAVADSIIDFRNRWKPGPKDEEFDNE